MVLIKFGGLLHDLAEEPKKSSGKSWEEDAPWIFLPLYRESRINTREGRDPEAFGGESGLQP